MTNEEHENFDRDLADTGRKDSGWSNMFRYENLDVELASAKRDRESLKASVNKAELHLNSLKYQLGRAYDHIDAVEKAIIERNRKDENADLQKAIAYMDAKRMAWRSIKFSGNRTAVTIAANAYYKAQDTVYAIGKAIAERETARQIGKDIQNMKNTACKECKAEYVNPENANECAKLDIQAQVIRANIQNKKDGRVYTFFSSQIDIPVDSPDGKD